MMKMLLAEWGSEKKFNLPINWGIIGVFAPHPSIVLSTFKKADKTPTWFVRTKSATNQNLKKYPQIA